MVVSVSPVVLAAPDRGDDLTVRVSAPATGRNLPIIIFAHGNGLSSDDYDPLVQYWAGHGFVVIQPTFLDSKRFDLAPNDPRTPLIWRYRVADIKRILDNLGNIEAGVPGLKGKLDRKRLAVVGHSYGGITAGMLLGARVVDKDGVKVDLSDPRIKVGVLLSTAGNGGADLSAYAAEHFPFMNPSFAEMDKPALIIAGDRDQSPLTTRGPDWYSDPYRLSPGRKCLVTLFGGEHMLGGISGENSTLTTDENPDRIAAVQSLSLAYLRSALYPDDNAWPDAVSTFKQRSSPIGRVDCK